MEVSRKIFDMELLNECGKGARFQIREVIGRGRRGLVRAAVDTHTGEWVAIKKISDIFEHVSDAIMILREIKLLRLLRHPDIMDIKHIILPSSPTDFKDIFIVFELMESDLHQVIMDNEDLTQEHHRFFLYQLLRAVKYLHTANVIHRDLKPKNILANANCKLKIHNFSLARASFSDPSSAIFWNVYASTRWYRAPELCGSFFSKYNPAIDIWSIGCVFAEMLTRKPLFPGKNMLHQLDLITNLLGTPSAESIAGVRNANARKYLSGMQKKNPVPFSQKFPGLDPLAVSLLERLLAFDPNCRPSAKEALADSYFHGLSNVDHEPTAQPIFKVHFEFEKRKLTKEDVRELIYQEILEYHPQILQKYVHTADRRNLVYTSMVDHFKKQNPHTENDHQEGEPRRIQVQHAPLPRKGTCSLKNENSNQNSAFYVRSEASVSHSALWVSQKLQHDEEENAPIVESVQSKPNDRAHTLSENPSVTTSNSVLFKNDAALSTSPTPDVGTCMKKVYDADYKSQYDTASWCAILEEADQLACLHEKSGHSALSTAKTEAIRMLKGDRGKARPRFSIRFPPKTEPTLHNVLKFEKKEPSETELGPSVQEIQHKISVPSMTELLEKLTQKGIASPDGVHCSGRVLLGNSDTSYSSSTVLEDLEKNNPSPWPSEFVRKNKRKERKTQKRTARINQTTRSSNNEDALEQVGSITSSEDEGNCENPLIPATSVKGQTMADVFQEAFTISTADVEGLPLATRAATGYYGRLQQIMQRDKDRHMKFVEQLHSNQSRGIDVKILSRVLDAKSIVCRCLFCGKPTERIESSQTGTNQQIPEEIGETTERIIIFSSKMCGNVELEVGNLICIYPPWKEVQIKEGDIIILCTYFSQIMR